MLLKKCKGYLLRKILATSPIWIVEFDIAFRFEELTCFCFEHSSKALINKGN